METHQNKFENKISENKNDILPHKTSNKNLNINENKNEITDININEKTSDIKEEIPKKNNNVENKFKDKVLMYNNTIEKNKNQDNGTKDFYTRKKSYFSKNNFKNNAIQAKNIDVKEYKQSFEKLHNLQTVLKKESSLRELCKFIIIIIYVIII